MKLKGQQLNSVNVETIVIPRGNGDPIVFKARAVKDLEEFNRICPPPKPPDKILPGPRRVPNFEDKGYQQEFSTYGDKRVAYLMIKSLEATEDLEWERVKLSDPNTWSEYDKELAEAGLNYIERQIVQAGVYTANSLNDSKIEEARQSFLASEAERLQNESTLETELLSMQSGEPASVSA